MNKTSIIKCIQQVKPEHIEWIRQGRRLVKGFPEEKITRPIQCEACNFTLWYESEGHKLVNIPQLKAVEKLHQEIHSAYTSLYYTTFDRRKKARATLITGDQEIPVDETPFRRKKLKELEDKTVVMLKALARIEKQVESMRDEDFDNGWLI